MLVDPSEDPNDTLLFGSLEYSTSYNIGDSIQTIAALELIPYSSSSDRIDRDFPCNTGPNLKVIYNGWFDGQYTNFPPPPRIDPLFVSFHINEQNNDIDNSYSVLPKVQVKYHKPAKSILSCCYEVEEPKESSFVSISDNVDYFKKYQPIGCRDMHTVQLLESKGVKAYFSGCLTLTLYNKFSSRTSEILVVDINAQCDTLFKQLVPENIRKSAIYLNQAVTSLVSADEKLIMARALLDRFAQAKLVITSPLHTALPCIAFNTPFVFIHPNPADVRFGGLDKLFTIHGPDTKPSMIDWNNIKEPQTPEFFKIRNSLIKTVNDWVECKHVNKSGNSIVTVSMDRTESLSQVLPTWIASRPDEIVIVDWGSKIPITQSLEPIISANKSLIKVVRVTNVTKWVLTYAYNLAIRVASYSDILKLDSDIKLNEKFFHYHNLLSTQKNSRMFFAGNWKIARNENEQHTNGIVYMTRNVWSQTGYNEYIVSYGWDDDDLYDRLVKAGYIRGNINLDMIQHIPHQNSIRTINQDIAADKLAREIEKNRLISCENIWHGPMSIFHLNGNTECATSSVVEHNFNHIQAQLLESVIIDPKISASVEQKLEANMKYKKQSRDKFFIYVKNGLGNRLRAFASAACVAAATNKKLVLLWIPDYHCEAKFTELFELNFILEGVDIIENAADFDLSIFTNGSAQQHHPIESSCGSVSNIYNYETNKDALIIDKPGSIYVASACVLNSPHTNWVKESRFLRYMRPVSSIMNKIYSFDCVNDCDELIAVHIRMGQNPTQDPNVNRPDYIQDYSDKTKTAVNKWRSASNWPIFLAEMKRILSNNKNQKFFVCYDNVEAWNALKESLPNNVITIERDLYDRSPKQIISAVVDVYILSKCKKFLGSNWSSLSELVSRLAENQTTLLAGINF